MWLSCDNRNKITELADPVHAIMLEEKRKTQCQKLGKNICRKTEQMAQKEGAQQWLNFRSIHKLTPCTNWRAEEDGLRTGARRYWQSLEEKIAIFF